MANEVPTFFEPPTQELQRNVTAATPRVPNPAVVNATIASRVHETTLRYPWVKPDVALAIAQSKFDLGSKEVAAMAGTAAASKKKRGFNWLSPGDWVDKGATAAKATTRAAFVGLGSGAEVVSQGFRAVDKLGAEIDAVSPLQTKELKERAKRQLAGEGDGVHLGPLRAFGGTTQLAVIIDKLRKGEKVDLGTGFFPRGKVSEEQASRARGEASVPDGQGGRSAATPGRVLAISVTEPGSTANKILSGAVDAAVAWKGDPASYALGKVSKAREASKTFGASEVIESTRKAKGVLDAAGAINGGARKSVVPQKVGQWLDGRGSKLLESVASDTSARRIWDNLPGVTPSQALELANSKTPEEARSILEPLLGVSIREKPNVGYVGGLPEKMRRTIGQVRILGQMPGKYVDANDANEVARQTVNWLKNAKVDPAIIDQSFNQIGRANSAVGRAQAVFDSFEHGYKAMLGDGVQDHVARAASRAFTDGRVGAGKYFVDNIGQNVGVLGATVNGDGIATATPQLITEYLDHAIPLPDARTIRRLTSPFRTLLAKSDPQTGETLPRVPLAALDFVFGKVWPTTTIARPALALRILGETQARMGAVGLDTMLTHAIESIAWIAGRKGDALGAEFDAADDLSKFAKTMSSRRATMSEGVLQRGWDVVPRGHQDYAKGLASELGQLHSDPVARRIAGGWSEGDRVPLGLTGNHVEDVKKWFWSGEPGKTIRKMLAEDTSKTELGTSRAASDRYVDEVFQRIQTKTSEHEDLMDVVATGKHGNIHIVGEGNVDNDGLNRNFMKYLSELTSDAGNGVGPAMVKTPKLVRSSKNNTLFDGLDKATDTIFHTILGAPLDKTMYSPAFKQFYWRRMGELAQHGSAEAKATILENAERFNISDNIVSAIRNAPHGGAYSAEDLHLLAGAYASENSLKYLDDLTTKSQFADIARNFFPFAEAWKDALKAWGSIATKNPASIRRFQQTIEGARNAGFFAPDPQTGEEVFTFPLSGQITRHVLGVNIPLTGRVGGLNVFSDSPLLPGFGPVVQLPVQKILPDKPQFDDLRRMISPYGSESLGASFVPAWASKAITALKGSDGDRVFANTVKDVSAVLYSSGDYDISTQDGVDHLLDDARAKARGLFLLRAIAQFAGPTSASPRFEAKVTGAKPKGLVTEGNLDLTDRPVVKNKDGSISTVRSITVESEGKYTLIPTVRAGLDRIMTNDEAIAYYRQTGEHLGIFDSEKAADKYAAVLHDEQATEYANGKRPTPSAKFIAADKNGDVALTSVMADRLQELRVQDRVARAKHQQLEGTANERFIAEFGPSALLFLQSKTQREGSGPVSQTGLNWVRNNKGVVGAYPDAYGYLAPQGPGFSFDAYNRLIRNGELRTLSPKEYIEAANARAAQMIYSNVRDQLGVKGAASTPGRVKLHDLREQLVKKFPGYTPGIVDTGRQAKLLEQLQRAVDDKRLSKNDVAQAVKVYLNVRQSALDQLEKAGYLSLSSKAAAPFATRLREVADTLVSQTPGFFDVYDQLFSHELGEE